MRKYLKVLSIFISVIIIAIVVFPVFAQEATDTTNTTSDETGIETSSTPRSLRPQAIRRRVQDARERNQEIRDNIKARTSAAAERRAEKLSQARLRVCQARQKGIAQRLKYMLERGRIIHKGHENVFARVDKFYNNKLVPAGYTLSNYNDLKAEIEANRANVQTLLETAKATGGDFDCDSEDPKGQVDAFHEDMKALIEANKEYKASIHDFVKAVRDLAKTARLDKISPSVSLTPTEGVSE